jgi:hypothetical protein
VGAQLGLVSSPLPTRAATGGQSRRLLRAGAGAASREAGAVPAASAPKAGEAASRQEMDVPGLLATQSRSCAAMAAR